MESSISADNQSDVAVFLLIHTARDPIEELRVTGDEARAELAKYGNIKTRIGQMEMVKCRELH
jgi:hypothetical protein